MKKPTTTPDNARNPHQRKIIEDFLAQGKDPFSRENVEKIHDGNGNYNQITYEHPDWYTMPCLWPLKKSSTHQMVILQRNDVSSLEQLVQGEFSSLLQTILHLKNQHRLTAGAFCMRFGKPTVAGTTVTHLHGHLISAIPDETVAFHVGGYGNPKKDFSGDDHHKTTLISSPWWELQGTSRHSDNFQIVQKMMPSSDLENVMTEEWNDLLLILTRGINDLKIPGGAICIRFGTPNSYQKVIVHLLVPKENVKFIFEI